MFRTSMLLILLCLHLTVSEERYNSKSEEYKVSEEGEVSDSTIILGDGQRGVQVPTGSDPSISLGLAFPVSGNSSVWTSLMTPRKAPSPDDPSINEIDSADYFPSIIVNISTTTENKDYFQSNNANISITTENKDYFPSNNVNISTKTENKDYFQSNNANISTTTENKDYFPSNNVNISITTEKPDIVWGLFINNSGIFPDPYNRVSISVIEWITSTNTTTEVPDTELTAPEHLTSLAEFIYAQLSLLAPMWTNFFKLTDHFSKEISATLNDTVYYVFDFLYEIIELFFSCFLAIEFDYDYDYDYQ